MPSIPQHLGNRLSELGDVFQPPSKLLVAFSGGIDSTVMLHALCQLDSPIPLVAVHVDHQLCEDSPVWEIHCRDYVESLGIQYISSQATVAGDTGLGPEGAAREARYGVFRSVLQKNEWLLTAHHQGDQAETLLLNLFRGSGPTGLSGIGSSQPFANGMLVRPMLGVTKLQIEEYAREENLDWIDDPSNAQNEFDRNFLRNEIVPAIKTRWPALNARLGRSAELASEARTLLDDLAIIDLEKVGEINKLDIGTLTQLSASRQRNLIRYAIRCLGLPSPPSTRLTRIIEELACARSDAQPFIEWPGVEVRRYRNQIYLLAAEQGHRIRKIQTCFLDREYVELGAGLGCLSVRQSNTTGIDPDVAASGLEIRFRQGGESIQPVGRDHTHRLKTLLQDAAVVPWMRARIPLLYSGDDLVAVGDLWVAKHFSADQGCEVVWENRPAIT